MMTIDKYRYVVYTTTNDKPSTEIYFCGNGKWSLDRSDAKVYHSIKSVRGAFAVMKRKYLGMPVGDSALVGDGESVKSVGWTITAE